MYLHFYDCMVYLLTFRNGRGHGRGHEPNILHKDRVQGEDLADRPYPYPSEMFVNLFGLLSTL